MRQRARFCCECSRKRKGGWDSSAKPHSDWQGSRMSQMGSFADISECPTNVRYSSAGSTGRRNTLS